MIDITKGQVHSSGPLNTGLLAVGEAPGPDEREAGVPFIGRSGKELNAWLEECGSDRAEWRVANACPWMPPKSNIDGWFYTKTAGLKAGIEEVHGKYPEVPVREGRNLLITEVKTQAPRLILALGNTALWALTGEWGITKWRGSHLPLLPEYDLPDCVVIPTYHPAGVLRMAQWRGVAILDVKRALREAAQHIEPDAWEFTIRPTCIQVMDVLVTLHNTAKRMRRTAILELSIDIETRAGHIACLAIAWSDLDAICIPFMCVENHEGYWTPEEELLIVRRLRKLFTQPHVNIIGQNYIYDAQYLSRWFFINPHRTAYDTMLAHHLCFPTLPKGLDFLSSIYCRHHVYWKDEGKLWDTSMPEDRWWAYNCTDACRTYQIASRIPLAAMGIEDQFAEKMRWFQLVFQTMFRGVRINDKLRTTLLQELMAAAGNIEGRLTTMIDDKICPPKPKAKPWYRSPKQQQALFYDTLNVQAVNNRKTGRPTVDDDALPVIGRRLPLLRPVCNLLGTYRSLNVLSGVLKTPSDLDGRMRCSYGLAGTITHRLNSSENAFGSGTNLQNITKGDADLGTPNLRRLFMPDLGKGLLDVDLKQADAQAVAWDANDQPLMDFFIAARTDPTMDLHGQNAADIFGGRADNKHPKRQLCKSGVHGANYGVQGRTLATTLGITVHEADNFLTTWFSAHPAIKKRQEEIERQVMETRRLTNVFGYPIIWYDRMDHRLIHQALAWMGQSVIAIVINRAWEQLVSQLDWVEVLLQTHDSLTTQFYVENFNRRDEIRQAMEVVCPYPAGDLIIPLDALWSTSSWGEVKEVSWK